MAEYIERRTAIEHLNVWCGGCGSAVECILAEPAADVAQVVRCKECENSYYAVDGLICSYGPCVDCPVSPDFWCANGRRREDAHAQD